MNHDEYKPGEDARWDLGVMSGEVSICLHSELKEANFAPIEFEDLHAFQIDWKELRYIQYKVNIL